MAKETTWKCTYEDLRPLLSLIHLYGVNWQSERGTGCRRNLKLLSCLIWSILYVCLTIFCLAAFFSDLKSIRGANSEDRTSTANILMVILCINATSFVVCLAQRKHLENLTRFFKKQPHDKEEEGKSIRRWRKTVKSAATYLYAISPLYLLTACLMTAVVSGNCGATVQSVLGHSQELILFIMRSVLLTFVIVSQVFFFAPAFFTCALAYYVSATCQDSLERLKACESPLRKARMSEWLLRKCVQLGEITAAADRVGAVTMYALKMGAVIVFLEGALCFVYEANESYESPNVVPLSLGTLLFVFSSTCLTIYCCFVRLAHAVNHVVTDLSKTLAEVWQTDCLMHTDSQARLHLLKMRVDQLIALTHLLIDRPAFTLLGEPVDGENLFTV